MNILLIHPDEIQNSDFNDQTSPLHIKIHDIGSSNTSQKTRRSHTTLHPIHHDDQPLYQRAKHIREQLKLTVGDQLRAGIINGRIGQATILKMEEHSIELEFEPRQAAPQSLPLTVVIALPRPKMLRRLLRALTELGTKDIYLIQTSKVEKSYWQTPALQPQQVERYFLAGLQQIIDTELPHLELRPRFKPFVEDELPQLLKARPGFVCHPGDYPPVPQPLNKSATLIIGPEGGFTDYEISLLQNQDCQLASLGERILRVETATICAIARLYNI